MAQHIYLISKTLVNINSRKPPPSCQQQNGAPHLAKSQMVGEGANRPPSGPGANSQPGRAAPPGAGPAPQGPGLPQTSTAYRLNSRRADGDGGPLHTQRKRGLSTLFAGTIEATSPSQQQNTTIAYPNPRLLYRNPEIREELREWRERYTVQEALTGSANVCQFTSCELAAGVGLSVLSTRRTNFHTLFITEIDPIKGKLASRLAKAPCLGDNTKVNFKEFNLGTYRS